MTAALIIIDAQQGLFDEGIQQAEDVLGNLDRLVDSARRSSSFVIDGWSRGTNCILDSRQPPMTGSWRRISATFSSTPTSKSSCRTPASTH